MKFNLLNKVGLALSVVALSLVTVACGSGGGGGSKKSNKNGGNPPPAIQTDFSHGFAIKNSESVAMQNCNIEISQRSFMTNKELTIAYSGITGDTIDVGSIKELSFTGNFQSIIDAISQSASLSDRYFQVEIQCKINTDTYYSDTTVKGKDIKQLYIIDNPEGSHFGSPDFTMANTGNKYQYTFDVSNLKTDEQDLSGCNIQFSDNNNNNYFIETRISEKTGYLDDNAEAILDAVTPSDITSKVSDCSYKSQYGSSEFTIGNQDTVGETSVPFGTAMKFILKD